MKKIPELKLTNDIVIKLYLLTMIKTKRLVSFKRFDSLKKMFDVG